MEGGFKVGQLLLDNIVIELLVDPADFSNDDEETVASKRAAELGMGELHQEAEHVDGFIVAGEIGVGSTKDTLVS